MEESVAGSEGDSDDDPDDDPAASVSPDPAEHPLRTSNAASEAASQETRVAGRRTTIGVTARLLGSGPPRYGGGGAIGSRRG
jgi:hypothetical protein